MLKIRLQICRMHLPGSWILFGAGGLRLTQEGCLTLTLADEASLDEDWDVGDLSLQANDDYLWLEIDD